MFMKSFTKWQHLWLHLRTCSCCLWRRVVHVQMIQCLRHINTLVHRWVVYFKDFKADTDWLTYRFEISRSTRQLDTENSSQDQGARPGGRPSCQPIDAYVAYMRCVKIARNVRIALIACKKIAFSCVHRGYTQSRKHIGYHSHPCLKNYCWWYRPRSQETHHFCKNSHFC